MWLGVSVKANKVQKQLCANFLFKQKRESSEVHSKPLAALGLIGCFPLSYFLGGTLQGFSCHLLKQLWSSSRNHCSPSDRSQDFLSHLWGHVPKEINEKTLSFLLDRPSPSLKIDSEPLFRMQFEENNSLGKLQQYKVLLLVQLMEPFHSKCDGESKGNGSLSNVDGSDSYVRRFCSSSTLSHVTIREACDTKSPFCGDVMDICSQECSA